MVNSTLENKTQTKSPCTRLKSTNELRSKGSSKFKNDDFRPIELKLSLKRIDMNNYVSILSPSSQKTLQETSQDNKSLKTLCVPTTPKSSKKSLRWSERNQNSVNNLVDELIHEHDDEDENFNTQKKHSRRISVFSTCSSESSDDELASILPEHSPKISPSSNTLSKSNGKINTLESVTPKRVRKPVKRFEEPDLNEIEILNTPKSKRVRKTTSRFAQELDSNETEIVNTPKKHKKSRKTSITDEDEDFEIDVGKTPVNKHSQKISPSSNTLSKSNSKVDSLESVTPKRVRKPVKRFDGPDLNKIEILNTPKSKRVRKTTSRFAQELDSNETEIVNTPKSNKKSRKTSITDEDEDIDYKIDLRKTPPINRHLRGSKALTTRLSSKIDHSILQNIPENKEFELVSTPKTPRKTPKARVKNLTASANRRLDSGALIPCSPLEKARANLHLHAAPKHLPCREVEFKSIYSFLARKINDELTGSMYISGVPGTGKTATVKRVIDLLNSDLIMKHSFKFVEINGLRLANPHQAFSVIWKELKGETVSSSRAQALLNDYFSGKDVRNLSTILLVDEVDHICNRKQDVVYNILDWPSRTGSKVVVITIANTMDLPERVLRGCVTSRMGLTRLVFKPYTFQQLQEIIMNRLDGNSSFDPDAVQLVARKVAAISGDARRALDICRRAIDLIKSEDDSQLITINHVNQVLNSILSGVRVTAIRYCSLFEQFFLRALRDETIRTGFDHSTIDAIYIQMKSICLLEGEELPNDQQVIMMAYRLRDNGLIFLEKKRSDVFRKVSLNVSPEDISYALDKYNN